jgi:3',5'-cyclic AMP phosphodiesterase CpdA
MNETGSGFSNLLVRCFLIGPHPPDPSRPSTLSETLLPWPVRLLVLVAALLLGRNWAGTPLGEQLGGGLQYAGLIVISLAVSYWWWIFLANLGLALIWVTWPLGASDDSPILAELGHVVTFLNRQIGHIEVLAVWLVLALVSADRLPSQLGMIAAVIFIGEPLLSGLAVWWFFPKPRAAAVVARDLFWKRRPLFYLATLLGFVLIALLAPRQAFKLVPGVLAVAAADFVRYLRHRRFARTMAQPQHTARLQGQHDRQLRMGRHTDVLLGPGLVLGGLALVVGASTWARQRYDQSLAESQPVRGEPVDYCANHFPPAPDADVALFIVSDSQFHELAGPRFVGQMEFADALVPVALRPIELDVLSASPLSHAATTYAALAAERPQGARLWWAHLGDMADLSCQNEMDRSNQLLRDRFDVNAFAGVAPGNHDKAFTGNFFWSPYWDSACRSGRLEKALSDEKLAAAWRAAVAAAHGRMETVPAWNPVASATRRGSALVTVTPLGLARDHQNRRGVIGIFLDSSDGQAFDLGVAGLFGTFSAEQAKTVNRLLAAVRDEAGGVYQDPIYLVFLHHPVDETAPDSNARFKQWLADLDGDGQHVLGIITAHTHEAQKHSHCIGRRMIPEIVVGSTIDPPQEASLLSVGPVADGTVALRVQTLPMVARPGKTCTARAPTLTSDECQRIVAGLRVHPDCAALFRAGEATSLGRDCSDIEHPLAINDRLQLAARWTGPGDEEEIRADQRSRTTALWSCICRDRSCTVSRAVLELDDPSYFALVRQELGRSPARERELTCLAWAGAAVQRYKTAGMSYGDALRCAFDDESLAAAHDYIARMEVTPCY